MSCTCWKRPTASGSLGTDARCSPSSAGGSSSHSEGVGRARSARGSLRDHRRAPVDQGRSPHRMGSDRRPSGVLQAGERWRGHLTPHEASVDAPHDSCSNTIGSLDSASHPLRGCAFGNARGVATRERTRLPPRSSTQPPADRFRRPVMLSFELTNQRGGVRMWRFVLHCVSDPARCSPCGDLGHAQNRKAGTSICRTRRFLAAGRPESPGGWHTALPSLVAGCLQCRIVGPRRVVRDRLP